MSQLDIIKSRRSIRRFAKEDISDDLMNQILDSVKWAPSWGNTQCWEIIVIKSPEIKYKLQKLITDKNPATQAIINAPVILALCGELGKAGYYNGQTCTKFNDWFMYDLGIVTQNIALTAHDLGLGSVVIGSFDHDQAKVLLQIPEGCEIVSLMPIGYSTQKPLPPKRKETMEFTHDDTYAAKGSL